MGHYLFVAASGMLIWGIIAPSSAAQFVQSLFLVAMRPIVVVQNGLAAGIAYLRGILEGLREQLGGPVRILGALAQLLIFILLTFSGFYVTVLSLAGIWGEDLTIDLPASLELLTGGSLVLGLAYLIGVLLELGGMEHFGHWNQLPAGLRKATGLLTLLLLGLGIYTSVQLGYARAELESLTTQESIEAVLVSDEQNASVTQVLVLLPLFIELTAALAFWGAISAPIVLFAALVLTAQLVLLTVNLSPTIAVQVLDAFREAAQAFFRFLADVGEALGLSIERTGPARQETDERPPPDEEPPDDPEPELTPIEEEHLDPLGIGRPT